MYMILPQKHIALAECVPASHCYDADLSNFIWQETCFLSQYVKLHGGCSGGLSMIGIVSVLSRPQVH